MQIGGSQRRLLLELTGGGITLIDGMDQPGQL